MMLNEAVMTCLLLLSGHGLTPGSAGPLCGIMGESRCICNVAAIRNVQEMVPCVNALEIELRDGALTGSFQKISPALVAYLPHFQTQKFIFSNVTISFRFLLSLPPILPQTRVNEIHVISSTIDGPLSDLQGPSFSEITPSKIKVLHLQDVALDPLLLHPFRDFHSWLLGPLKRLGLVCLGLAEVDCYLAGFMGNLTRLDLSENQLSEASLLNASRCSLPFASVRELTSLSLRDNKLDSFQTLCGLLGRTPALADLDVSGNNFSMAPSPHCLQVAEGLRVLNLSRSVIAEAGSPFPASLEELDLSGNALEEFHSPPRDLKRLHLSNNHLMTLPSLEDLHKLQVLKVDGNRLTTLVDEKGGVTLAEMDRLHVLLAGGNPYHCDCGTLGDTVTFLRYTHKVSVEDWPEGFTCSTPPAKQGTQLLQLTCGSVAHKALLPLLIYCLSCFFVVVFL